MSKDFGRNCCARSEGVAIASDVYFRGLKQRLMWQCAGYANVTCAAAVP